MKAIDPAELSAYIDGELADSRVEEIGKALASDPAVREEYEQLRALDSAWRFAARSAVARPSFRPATTKRDMRVGLAIVLLLAVRFLPKLGDFFLWAIVLHAGMLLIALAVIIRIVRMDALAASHS
jgi:anti-sigma factor RsiW